MVKDALKMGKPTLGKVKAIVVFPQKHGCYREAEFHTTPDVEARAKAQTGVSYSVELNILYVETHP